MYLNMSDKTITTKELVEWLRKAKIRWRHGDLGSSKIRQLIDLGINPPSPSERVSATAAKVELLRIAHAGKPKPPDNTALGRAVRHYLNPNDRYHDHGFYAQIKETRPDWVIEGHHRKALRLEDLVKALPRCNSVTEMAAKIGASRAGVVGLLKRNNIPYPKAKKTLEESREETVDALGRAGGDVQAAARLLGIHSSPMYHRVHSLGLGHLTVDATARNAEAKKTATDGALLAALRQCEGDTSKAAVTLGISLAALYGRIANARERNPDGIKEALKLKVVVYKHGRSVDQVSQETGVHRSVVYRALAKGMSVEDIVNIKQLARETGLPYNTASRWLAIGLSVSAVRSRAAKRGRRAEMSPNDKAQRLLAGETIVSREPGNSMTPKLQSRQPVRLAPATWEQVEVGDVVYVKVRGSFYTHLVKAKQNDKGCLIGNNRGGTNGWSKQVYGKVVEVLPMDYKG
jgi:transposase-like protein